jgi:DNA polymerase-3 subunit delta
MRVFRLLPLLTIWIVLVASGAEAGTRGASAGCRSSMACCRAMARTGVGDVLGSITLVMGPEEFLAERAVSSLVQTVRQVDTDADLTEIAAGDVAPGALGELTSPSLFASVRVVVIRALQDLPDEAVPALLAFAGAPAVDIALVLVHGGGQKGKATLDKLRAHGHVRELKAERLKRWELPRFVSGEARRAVTPLTEEAAAVLADSVGEDLRALAAAVDQLASDFSGQEVTASVVRKYFDGRAEVKGFAVADAALSGNLPSALEQLRWALHNGVAPVLVTSAFASGLRGLARFLSAPRGLRDVDLARECGVQTWKLKDLRAQSRGWTPEAMSSAIHAVARADADVKGAAGDADYALERMVLAVAHARSSR